MSANPKRIKRHKVLSFASLFLGPLFKLTALSLFKPTRLNNVSAVFSNMYSKLWDFAEHSISHEGFNLPSALGEGPVHRLNTFLSDIYGAKFSSLSMGGSSGALLTLLTAVLPKLHPNRDLILFDDVCHQSTIGGLIFGRWNAVRLVRDQHPIYKTVSPIKFEKLKAVIERHGSQKFAAIILVGPSYDGFKSPSEDKKIYQYAKSHGISVVIDGAWDAMRFRRPESYAPPLSSICDIWITSPHKRGLTPCSMGCILTDNKLIARLWDEALDLGFRSSSVSFVDCMVAEYRLAQIASGHWDKKFETAERAARHLTEYIQDIHPDVSLIQPDQVHAETKEPSHLLITTHKLPKLDARDWAKNLSVDFGLDVEKATRNSVLLICGSPDHVDQIDDIISCLKQALTKTMARNYIPHNSNSQN